MADRPYSSIGIFSVVLQGMEHDGTRYVTSCMVMLRTAPFTSTLQKYVPVCKAPASKEMRCRPLLTYPSNGTATSMPGGFVTAIRTRAASELDAGISGECFAIQEFAIKTPAAVPP